MAEEKISGLTEETTVADTDMAVVATAGGTTRKITWANIKATLQAYVVGGTDVAVADGGTGSSTAAGARTNLGLGTAAVANTGDFDAAGAAAAAQSASQPVDSDLTAIAALTTTSYGRAFLALADAAAGRTALGLGTAATHATGDYDAAGAAAAAQAASQPLDSDLTAIAALTTTSYGRALLALADATAGRTALGLGTLSTQSGTFSGTSSGTNTGDQTLSDATITTTDITTNNVSTSKHGFAPKAPNVATQYLDGTGAYSVPAGSGAPSTATYITQVAESGLSAEQSLAALATGLLKSTTTTGVLSIGAEGTDYWKPGGTDVAVADGGTGASTAATARSNLGIAAVVGGVEWTVVTKASDESVSSSAVLQNDDELFFTAVSTGMYEFEVVIVYASPVGAATPDLKVAVGEDATARGGVISSGLTNGDAASGAVVLTNQSSTVPFGTAAANRIAKLVGVHQGAGGTFRLLWCQNTSDANATTVRAGSLIRYRRIV